MKKKKFYEFNKILMIALIMSFSFLIAGIVGININKDLGNINSVANSGNIVDPDDTDGSYETLNYSQKDIGKTVETVGSGTEEDPYIISNIDQWLYLTGIGRYSTMEGIYETRELPEGYTQVDYISSTGGWFDAEYAPNENTKIEFIMKNTNWRPFETGMKSSDGNNFYIMINNGINYAFNSNSSNKTNDQASSWRKYEMYGYGDLVVDGSVLCDFDGVLNTDLSLYIFKINENGSALQDGHGYGNLYSYKIYEGETLIKDFVPCETSEGLVGLYDVVNDKFHENLGENNFSKGSQWVSHSKNYLESAYVELAKDLYFNDGYFEEDGTYHDEGDGVLWDCAGSVKTFKGVLDGKNYTMNGFYGIRSYPMLFYSLSGATIKNISFENTNITFNSHYYGAFFNSANNSILDNVKLHGQLQNPNHTGIGGFVYSATNTIFQNCENDTTISCNSNTHSGGFAVNATDCKFLNCKSYGNCTKAIQAGFVSNANNCYFEKCENYGNFIGSEKGSIFVGGGSSNRIYYCKNFGELQVLKFGIGGTAVFNSSSNSEVVGCVNYGEIKGKTNHSTSAINSSSSTYVRDCINYGNFEYGGFGVGYGSTIENCINYGDFGYEGGNPSGGAQRSFLSGIAYTATRIINCINYGEIKMSVSGFNEDAAGIVKELPTGGVVSGCINYGNVQTNGYNWRSTGGIVSVAGASSSITNCINYGTIKGSEAVGGILGRSDSAGITISNCKNYGKIMGSSAVGGVAGEFGRYTKTTDITILNCFNYADINGTNIGGIVGYNYNTNFRIIGCVNEGNIIGARNLGGIAGVLNTTGSYIEKSINKGEVNYTGVASSNNQLIGGLIGSSSTSVTIKSSLNIGKSNYLHNFTDSFSGNGLAQLENCLEDTTMNGTPFKRAFGKDFSDFYWSWRTGKIGIKSIDGNGLFQGDVNAEYLQKQGFEGDYMPEEPDPGNGKYTQLEYIEILNDATNGYNNGINTEISWNEVNQIKVSHSTACATSTNRFMIFRTVGEASPWIGYSGAGQSVTFTGISGTQEDSKKLEEYVNGEKQETTYIIGSTNSGKILYGCWQDASWSGSSMLYAMKMYKNGELVRNFIPVKRNLDGEIGLYDRVEGKFYTNQGSGDFVAGKVIG